MERIDDLNIKGLKVIQNTDYFLFGMDSVLLANMVKAKKEDIILDLGTGSMVMPILISAKTNSKKIIGVELQKEMYDLAVRNIQLNGLEERLSVIKEDIKNIAEIRKEVINITGKDKVDIIISNPPYKVVGTGSESIGDVKYIARHEVKLSLEDIFKTVSKLLKNKGKLYIVHKPERMVDLLSFGRKYKLEAKNIKLLQPNKNKRPSIVIIEYVLDGGNECKIEPVIMEYNEDGSYTEEILKIYGMEE